MVTQQQQDTERRMKEIDHREIMGALQRTRDDISMNAILIIALCLLQVAVAFGCTYVLEQRMIDLSSKMGTTSMTCTRALEWEINQLTEKPGGE